MEKSDTEHILHKSKHHDTKQSQRDFIMLVIRSEDRHSQDSGFIQIQKVMGEKNECYRIGNTGSSKGLNDIEELKKRQNLVRQQVSCWEGDGLSVSSRCKLDILLQCPGHRAWSKVIQLGRKFLCSLSLQIDFTRCLQKLLSKFYQMIYVAEGDP